MSAFENIGVVGGGSWGTALALALGGQGVPLTVWAHNRATAEEVQRTGENRTYLPGVPIPPEIHFTAELAELRGSDLLLLVTPSRALRETAARLAKIGTDAGAVLLSCTKGVERGTGSRMSEILHEHFPSRTVAVLSGPSHAEELARQRPTAVVLGCTDRTIGRRLQQVFSRRSLRAYTSEDVAGIELGGALKNIYAIAAGVCDGLELGDNAKSALVTRALAELIRFGSARGGRRETFQGLSGIGDLMVTCFSRHSRNRGLGERLGRGEKLADILASMQMVAEGVPTTYSVFESARQHGVETPIIDQTRALLESQVSPREAMERLLSREPKPE